MAQAYQKTGLAKKKEVGRLLQVLKDGLVEAQRTPADVLNMLTQLKVYGRDRQNAEPIYCKEGISVLAEYAFADASSTSREALRCIANALYLAPELRQVFLDLKLLSKTAEKLKTEDYDDEFLISRVLFLLTYEPSLNQNELLQDLSVSNSVNSNLKCHARAREASKEKSPTSGMAVMALSETLKLLFNLSTRPENALLFQQSVQPILSILRTSQLPLRCLDPPINSIINAFVNLDLEGAEAAKSTESTTLSPADRRLLGDNLLELLEKALITYTETELETSLPSLLTVLRKVYDAGPDDLRISMQRNLLPLREDRDLPLGKSDTLASQLLRLSSSAMAPLLRELIPALMFELSDQDPKKFIENIGYGYAAGFLASHNIAMPENSGQPLRVSRNSDPDILVNPITGQRLDKEPEDTGPPMTMEEKEREAERLFVLFERLNATGVMNVQNPVRRARDEGKLESRVEEVDDSD